MPDMRLFERQIAHDLSGGSRWGSRGSLEHPLRQNYFIFVENVENLKCIEVESTNQIPFVKLSPLSRNPESAPGLVVCRFSKHSTGFHVFMFGLLM